MGNTNELIDDDDLGLSSMLYSTLAPRRELNTRFDSLRIPIYNGLVVTNMVSLSDIRLGKVSPMVLARPLSMPNEYVPRLYEAISEDDVSFLEELEFPYKLYLPLVTIGEDVQLNKVFAELIGPAQACSDLTRKVLDIIVSATDEASSLIIGMDEHPQLQLCFNMPFVNKDLAEHLITNYNDPSRNERLRRKIQ